MRRSSMSHLSACTLVAGLLVAAAPGHAYRMIQQFNAGRQTSGATVECGHASGFAHWNISNISWFHNQAGQGSGKTTALQNAMFSWTNVADASHVLTYAGTTGAGFATDGLNTLVWGTDAGCVFPCLALTALVLQQPGQVIVESDVLFNSTQPWTTNGSNFDTESVAAHELGHSLGIHHTEDLLSPTPTMKTPYFG